MAVDQDGSECIPFGIFKITMEYMGGSINGGTQNPKWMIYNGKSPSKMTDLGVPLF